MGGIDPLDGSPRHIGFVWLEDFTNAVHNAKVASAPEVLALGEGRDSSIDVLSAGPARRQDRIVKRAVDLVLATLLTGLALLPSIAIAALVKATSSGPVLYWSKRVGRDNKTFVMPKFRTMRVGTPAVATHLLLDPTTYLTPVGGFLRRTSLDEIPQLLSILKGDMSFVGPRPALFNQLDLIDLRTSAGVHHLVPGLTGWAQVKGRDGLKIEAKVRLDAEYLKSRSLRMDTSILTLTLVKVIKGDGVSH